MYAGVYEQLGRRDSAIVKDALTRVCHICDAQPGEVCTNMPINGFPLSGRLVHFERTAA